MGLVILKVIILIFNFLAIISYHRKVSIWNLSSWISLILVNLQSPNQVDQNWPFSALLQKTTRRYCMFCLRDIRSRAKPRTDIEIVQECSYGKEWSLGLSFYQSTVVFFLTTFEKCSAVTFFVDRYCLFPILMHYLLLELWFNSFSVFHIF